MSMASAATSNTATTTSVVLCTEVFLIACVVLYLHVGCDCPASLEICFTTDPVWSDCERFQLIVDDDSKVIFNM